MKRNGMIPMIIMMIKTGRKKTVTTGRFDDFKTLF